MMTLHDQIFETSRDINCTVDYFEVLTYSATTLCFFVPNIGFSRPISEVPCSAIENGCANFQLLFH